MESLWPRLAELPLVIESCEYDRLHDVLAHEFQRVTTHVRLIGAGATGLGEDISVHVEDGSSLRETQPTLPLEGESPLAGLCDHPARWSCGPSRRSGKGSALPQVCARVGGARPHAAPGPAARCTSPRGRTAPVRFVNSLGLGERPSIEHVRRRLARSPGVRFKLDAEATWSRALVDERPARSA